ncbi:MAG: hypothetical protein BGO55_20100 [Sphingobacteriales bacterium 50-39]|nr:glycosyl transferase [Sphingobacteriales bacterium]OJW59005.1 MAG: hypothetical protein BGO55_20100 [Sphingobacteriales bacterium 50-39]
MINFCTLFDSNYLSRGLALHGSLSAVCPSFHLYVVAFDDTCYEYLSKAGLPNLTPISLKEFEDEQLLAIKPTRSAAEYCWTCTPSIILYCIRQFNLPTCTYIDADMLFYQDPAVLLDEMGDKSILISEHRYTKDYDQAEDSGIYCVQFMYFRNDPKGMAALRWWRERCLEWCYARMEDGKFGDQKYLDDWLQRFEGVHVLQHPGGGLAPWNIQQYSVYEKDGRPWIRSLKDQQIAPVVFFHFHGLKIYTDEKGSCSGILYDLDRNTKEKLFKPYMRTLWQISRQLIAEEHHFNSNGARSAAPSRGRTFLDFLIVQGAAMRAGKISPFRLKNYNFSRHYHFYNLTNLS